MTFSDSKVYLFTLQVQEVHVFNETINSLEINKGMISEL